MRIGLRLVNPGMAAKTIGNKVRRARLDNILGSQGSENVQGEEQLKLDVIANEIIMRCLGDRASVAVVASEEDEEPRILRRGGEGGLWLAGLGGPIGPVDPVEQPV